MNILAACSGSDSPVRKLVFKSSAHYYGCEQDDPAFFTEEMRRPHPPHTALERDIVDAEESVSEFTAARPEVTATVLRCRQRRGPGRDDRLHAHVRPAAGPDGARIRPRCQFVHEDDVVRALEHAVFSHVPGLRGLGFRIPDEMVNQLRFGRRIDNRKLRAVGFRYEYTSREAAIELGKHLRIDPVVRGHESTYTYEREVEEFLRRSPHVRRPEHEEPLGF